jgi:hypothetical protein
MYKSIYQEIAFNIIINHKNIHDIAINRRIILEYLTYIPFDIMELEDCEEFIEDLDYNINSIKTILEIFKSFN